MSDYFYETALTLVPGLGSKTIRQLLDLYNTAQEVFKLPHSELKNTFGNHVNLIDAIENHTTFARADEELAFAQRYDIHLLYYTDAAYPQRLNRPNCEDTPVLLYYKGAANLNAERVISVVGTRRATEYGREMTQKLVAGLRQQGILVVSGLAFGIDTAAHTASVANGIPTVGVVAHGLDQLYPPQNRQLASNMVSQGEGLITEYTSKTVVQPGMFPARNRIIAALADAVVVVEAGNKGGALITANLAIGYNREVLAFPGRVGDKYSEGCNRIISNSKAVLIQNSDDLLAVLNWDNLNSTTAPQPQLFPTLTDEETILYNLLNQQGALSMEEMMQRSNLSLPKIASLLLALELKSLCKCLPGKIYKLI